MLRATGIVRRAAVKAERVAGALVLDHRARIVRRAEATTEDGLAVAIELPSEAALEDGDALRLEDGRLLAVRAAAEPLLVITTETASRLLRLAWRLGSEHVPTEIGGGELYVPDDPEVAELVRGLGGTSRPVTRPFRPERGGHGHHHHHGHNDGHGHERHHHDDGHGQGRHHHHHHGHDHDRHGES